MRLVILHVYISPLDGFGEMMIRGRNHAKLTKQYENIVTMRLFSQHIPQ